MRWFTSDTHFGHDNIIEFCERPYASTDHMNADMLSRLATAMSAGDTLWHLGDLALGVLDQTLPFISGVGVPTTLVAGNHDRCHPYYGTKSQKFEDLYLRKAVLAELITTNTELTLTDGTTVNVSHFRTATTTRGPTAAATVASSRTSSRRGASKTTDAGCCAGTCTRSGASAAA